MLLVHLLAQAAVVAAPQQAVIAYPPSFFESFRPTNALEMVERVPGFTFDAGDTVRGFEGAAGNVLIDGQRQAAKSDTLDQIRARIPASQVERIELIRGGAGRRYAGQERAGERGPQVGRHLPRPGRSLQPLLRR